MILNNEFTRKKDFRTWQRILVELLYSDRNMSRIRKKLDYIQFATMNNNLKRLEGAGFVEFSRDKRVKVVKLTLIGEKLAKNFEKAMSDFKNGY